MSLRAPLRLAERRPRPALALAAVSALFEDDLEGCLRSIERTVATGRARGASLVVFTEAALGGYLREQLVDGGERRSAPAALANREATFARLGRAADEAAVCAGYAEAGPQDTMWLAIRAPSRRAA